MKGATRCWNPCLPGGAANLGAIIAKLAVVARLIWPDDHPQAHALISGSDEDLIGLSYKDAQTRTGAELGGVVT